MERKASFLPSGLKTGLPSGPSFQVSRRGAKSADAGKRQPIGAADFVRFAGDRYGRGDGAVARSALERLRQGAKIARPAIDDDELLRHGAFLAPGRNDAKQAGGRLSVRPAGLDGFLRSLAQGFNVGLGFDP